MKDPRPRKDWLIAARKKAADEAAVRKKAADEEAARKRTSDEEAARIKELAEEEAKRQRKLAAEEAYVAEQRRILETEETERRNKLAAEEAEQELAKAAFDGIALAWEFDGDPCEVPITIIRHWTKNFKTKLGEGAFGKVFKGEAFDSILVGASTKSIPFAVKVFDIGMNSAQTDGDLNQQKIVSFNREMNLLKRFRHPHIVRLLGFCRADRFAYLLYELLSSGDLAGHLHSVNLSWKMRVGILLQIATALNYLHCHNKGYPAFHRDVKSANIGLDANYVPKLIDCGLSKYIDEHGKGASITTTAGQHFGTIGYKCPHYAGRTTMPYDAKCEVYSFGIVLLEVVTGMLQNSVHQFNGKTDEILLHEIKENDIPFYQEAGEWPSDCKAELAKLATECVGKYSSRIETMAEVVKRLCDLKERCCISDSDRAHREHICRFLARISNGGATSCSLRCSSCFMDVPKSEGYQCPNERCKQFLCCRNGCFDSIVREQINSEAFGSDARKCNIVCAMCKSIIEFNKFITKVGYDTSLLYSNACFRVIQRKFSLIDESVVHSEMEMSLSEYVSSDPTMQKYEEQFRRRWNEAFTTMNALASEQFAQRESSAHFWLNILSQMASLVPVPCAGGVSAVLSVSASVAQASRDTQRQLEFKNLGKLIPGGDPLSASKFARGISAHFAIAFRAHIVTTQDLSVTIEQTRMEKLKSLFITSAQAVRDPLDFIAIEHAITAQTHIMRMSDEDLQQLLSLPQESEIYDAILQHVLTLYPVQL